MPAVSAGNCDPIDASLRASLEGANSGSSYLDEQLISSTKRVLLTKIDFHSAEKEYSSLKSLQSKYIHLNSNSEGSLNHKEDNYGSSSVAVNGSHEDCRLNAGLANLGNTCFLNATLQCLTYTPPLVNHLIEYNEHTSAVPVKQWDADIKDGLKNQLNDPPLKNRELSNSAMLGNLNNGTASVVEILKKGGRGYGDGVKSWDGCQSMVNRDMEQEMHFNYSRSYSDAYNQGYDRGKSKKVKHPRRYNSNANLGQNPFQRMHDLNEAGKYFTPKS